MNTQKNNNVKAAAAAQNTRARAGRSPAAGVPRAAGRSIGNAQRKGAAARPGVARPGA